MNSGSSYIDVESARQSKAGQVVAGDVFVCRKIKEEGRVIAVLSDGLGSGVKASVLANLTATMAMKYTEAFEDIRKSAMTIMETLPVCEQRKISYSTFTIIDVDVAGNCRVIEHGNPPAILLRGRDVVEFSREAITLETWKDREIGYGQVKLEVDDRLVCFSDGVSQAGMGSRSLPQGWGEEGARRWLGERIREEGEISARQLSQWLVERALWLDDGKAKDDITAAVLHYRRPRRLMVLTGPPFARERDRMMADICAGAAGKKVIAGGTTAGIIARELGRKVEAGEPERGADGPPTSRMEGIDLVTEGTMTLAKVAELLERGEGEREGKRNGAQVLTRMLMESDIVDFVVGTRVNEAHQDPNGPVELDLRRNIVRRLTGILESRYLKETSLRLV